MEKTRNYIYLAAFTIIFFALNFTAFSQSQRPIVQDINAYPSSTNTINISWSLPTKTTGSNITKLIIYKDTRPIQKTEILSALTPIAVLPFGSVSYTDTVTDFNDYFYAVISVTVPGDFSMDEELYYDEELDSPAPGGNETPYLVILPGVNSTVSGVAVKPQPQNNAPESQSIAHDQNQNTRNQPLPYIDFLGEGIPETKQISDDTKKQALTLVSSAKNTSNVEILEPYVFEDDLISPSGGDEWLLFEILRTYFIKNDYENCLQSLTKFLAQNRTKEVLIRAKFYQGECCYYLGRYQEALNLFLELDEELPAQSKKWTESTLNLYKIR